MVKIIIFTAGAGACIPLGGIIAYFEIIHPTWLEKEFRHFVIAFGGGILLGAVAIVLVPEGEVCLQDSALAVPILLLGGMVLFCMERFLGLRRREAPQFAAMILDYIPESLALGGIIAIASAATPLLALLIGLQNLPEGVNAYRELKPHYNNQPHKILLFMVTLIPIGPIFGLIGWFFLSEYSYLLGAVMLFASGGILYLILQPFPGKILRKLRNLEKYLLRIKLP